MRKLEIKQLTHCFEIDTGDQQDPQEFATLFLNTIEEALRTSTSNPNSSSPALPRLISSIFKGTLTQVVVCKTCNNRSPRRYDDDLRLPITRMAANVQESIDAYLEPEILSGENMYFCENCGKKTKAEKFIEVRMGKKRSATLKL